MNTFEFMRTLTSDALNENLYKTFNVKVDFKKYDREQLEDYRNILRTKVHQLEHDSKFNDLLTNETYQRDKYILGVLNTKIKEMLGEARLAGKATSTSQQKFKGKMQAMRSGKKLNTGKKTNESMSSNRFMIVDEITDPSNPDDVIEVGINYTHVPEEKETPRSFSQGGHPGAAESFEDLEVIELSTGVDITDHVNDAEISHIIMQHADSEMNARQDDYGDYRYQQHRDRELDENSSHVLSSGKTAINTYKLAGRNAMKTENKKPKPDFLDLDKDKNKKEPMKKAVADKKKTDTVKESKMSSSEKAHHHAMEYARHLKEGNLEMAIHHRDACDECGGMIQHGPDGKKWHMHSGINKGRPYPIEEGMPGNSAQGLVADRVTGMDSSRSAYDIDQDRNGTFARESKENRKIFRARKELVAESIAYYLAEDEEGKAKAITAGADMVNDFTSWMQRVGNYQTKSMIELSDNIRANFGMQEAETFKSAVAVALGSTLEVLTNAREEINNAVAVLAGEAPAQEPMGQDTAPGAARTAPIAGGDDEGSLNLPSVDDFEASDAAAGGMETAGRMKRESIERGNRIMNILSS